MKKRQQKGLLTLKRAGIGVSVALLLYLSFKLGTISSMAEEILPYQTIQPKLNANPTTQPKSIAFVERVSKTPRVFLYHNFLPEESCDHIIKLGDLHDTEWALRWNEGEPKQATLPNNDDAILLAIQTKISDWTQLPPTNGELFSVIRYSEGEAIHRHLDYFAPKDLPKEEGNRLASVYIFLNDVEGGELIIGDPGNEVTIKPKKGNAVLLWNITPDGILDVKSQHEVTKIRKGNKWVLAKFIRTISLSTM